MARGEEASEMRKTKRREGCKEKEEGAKGKRERQGEGGKEKDREEEKRETVRQASQARR